MTADNALRRGESDAGSFILRFGMEPLKNSKQFSGIFHIETRAIIAQEKRRLSPAFGFSEFLYSPASVF